MGFISDIIDIKVFLVFCVAFLLVSWLMQRAKNLPPGPYALPVIGNFIQLTQHCGKLHVYFHELGKKYGGLFTFRIGPATALILTDHEIIKEALLKKAEIFSSRPIYRTYYKWSHADDGVILSNGDKWKSLRRLTLVALRDFGVGKKSLEERINEEARAVLEVIRKTDAKPFGHRLLLQSAVSNIICSLVFGSRFEYEDENFKRLVEIINYNLTSVSFADGSNIISTILSHATLRKMKKGEGDLRQFIHDQIKERKETFDRSCIRDFVDLHLDGQSNDAVIESTAGTSLHRTIQDLFMAGTETTSTTVNWALLYMIRYPEIQKMCHEELDREIGRSRPPSIGDRQNCKFVEATLKEVQRLCTILPLALPHCVIEDTTLKGYNIPKGTIVMVNLHAVHMDPKIWDKPEEFRPQRWLEANGELKKKDSLVPFSIGPRACLGEILARMEVFLFFTSLLQEFDFKAEDEKAPPSLEGSFGITYAPANCKICAIPR